MKKILIKTADISLEAELFDTPTARLIYDALPFQNTVQRWGDEIYFSIPVRTDLEKEARDVLEIGELGYWPVGAAFCIFWGATPASMNNEPRAASAVNVFGRIIGNTSVLQRVSSGADITIEKAD